MVLVVLCTAALGLDAANMSLEGPERAACRGERIIVKGRYTNLLKAPSVFVVTVNDTHGLYDGESQLKISMGEGEVAEHNHTLAIPIDIKPGSYDVTLSFSPLRSPHLEVSETVTVEVGDCVAEGGAALDGEAEPPASVAENTGPTGHLVLVMAVAGAIAVVAVALYLAATRRSVTADGAASLPQQAQAYSGVPSAYPTAYPYEYPYGGASYYAGYMGYNNVYQRI